MRFFLIVSMLLIHGINTARSDDAVSPDFSGYPRNSFAHYSAVHEAKWHLTHSSLLAISIFSGGDDYALYYLVTQTGAEKNERDFFNWAGRDLHRKQLSETDLGALREAIRGLPATSVTPPLERLVIVSFRDGDRWVTRSYDSKTLPEAMRQIYNLIGRDPRANVSE